jgi:hypothetical protein
LRAGVTLAARFAHAGVIIGDRVDGWSVSRGESALIPRAPTRRCAQMRSGKSS